MPDASGFRGEPYAALRETHTSVVLLLGDRAYKVKKPVRLPFIDLSTREARLADCRREVELNRRTAPDVYLGVDVLRPLLGEPGDDGEPVVVMRRMPEDRRLVTLLADPAQHATARRCVLDVARQVAVLHAAAPAIEGYDLPGTLARLWWEGWEQTQAFRDRLVDGAVLDEVYALAAEYLGGRAGLLRDRARTGLVRDGHGDLVAEDVFCLEDGPRVLDCLEFDEALRVGDVLMDVAFLEMDLALHGAPELGREFVARYRELHAEQHPRSLEDHYVAYRAWVRAKVECLRAGPEDPAGAGRAAAALELCRRALRSGRVHLVLAGGLPGSGKSSLARRLVDADTERDWVHISSDAVRKELAHVAPATDLSTGVGVGAYEPAAVDAVYDEVLRRAAVALRRGVSVVVDASWTRARHRELAAALAEEHAAALTEVRCQAPDAVCLERIAMRRGGPHDSDATAEVHRHLAATEDPWPGALALDTTGSPDLLVAHLLEALVSTPVTPRTAPLRFAPPGS